MRFAWGRTILLALYSQVFLTVRSQDKTAASLTAHKFTCIPKNDNKNSSYRVYGQGSTSTPCRRWYDEDISGSWTVKYINTDLWLWTKNNGTKLTWSNINSCSRSFNVALIIHLCVGCTMDFQLVDEQNKTLASTTVSSRSFHNSWRTRLINLHANLTTRDFEDPVRLNMFTRIGENSSDVPSWGVHPQFRLCEEIGSTKCKNDTIDPPCECGRGSFCKGMYIYDEADRRFCVPGYGGENCVDECPQGFYGWNCDNDCAVNGCGNRTCDRVSGKCLDDCRDHYLPPDCAKKLERPVVLCRDETDLRINDQIHLSPYERGDVRFQIRDGDKHWRNIDTTRDQASSYWKWMKSSIETMNRGTYSIRAVLNFTEGPVNNFSTDCWQPAKIRVVSASPRSDNSLIFRWSYSKHFWENVRSFEILVKYLNASRTTKPLLQTKHLFRKSHKLYEAEIRLRNKSNYKFVVTTNSDSASPWIEVWYLFPDEVSSAIVEKKRINSTMEAIVVNLSSLNQIFAIRSMVYVVMKNSSTCPIMRRLPANGTAVDAVETKHSSKSEEVELENLQVGAYPACQLWANGTYEFTIAVQDSGIRKLVWLVGLLILVVVSVLLAACVLYPVFRKLKCGPSDSTPTLQIDNGNVRLQFIDKQQRISNCEPFELQNLKSFEDYVHRAAENGLLQQQFTKLPKGLVRPCEYGRLPENRSKNRYGSLIAYDHSRVPLIQKSAGGQSGYINANYVNGYAKPNAYIATQGPLPNTILDFWHMIWQEEVQIICMLVDLPKGNENVCEQYWPEENTEMRYGDVTVSTSKQDMFADYTYRTFILKNRSAKDSRIVEHLQYTGWSQGRVPMHSHSIVEYLSKLLSLAPGQGPVVVHCAAGTGRTGVIILCDIALRSLAAGGTVDMFAEAEKMYEARANMLASMEQYVLAHLVPTQCLFMLPTKVLCSDLTEGKIAEMKMNLPGHMARLEETSWMEKAFRPLEPLRPPHPENIAKNRFPKLTPVGPNLITLSRYPSYDENSGYISAVSVDGPRIRKQYIASQLPMPSTTTDFWRLIAENNIEVIVVLQQPDPEDETCCDVVPRRTTLIPLPCLKVETKSTSKCSNFFTQDNLWLTDTSVSPESTRNITVFSCNHWSPEEVARPPTPEALVELWRASERIRRPEGRTLVLCYDGLTGCGLYLALSFMLDRMGADQECDVIFAVQAVRRSRPDFVNFQWQFEYLYDAAIEYSNCFRNYDNFTRDAGSS